MKSLRPVNLKRGYPTAGARSTPSAWWRCNNPQQVDAGCAAFAMDRDGLDLVKPVPRRLLKQVDPIDGFGNRR
jgi:hypothetical protein